jgi:hypothetical protein
MKRIPLYKMFAERGFSCGAEVGVYTGKNAENMFKCIPGLKLYLIDPWAGIMSETQTYDGEKVRNVAKTTLAGNNTHFIEKTSTEASLEIADRTLDFVYIDGLHTYAAVLLDILLWSPKIRPGGILSGHDYGGGRLRGVKRAVDDYTRRFGLKLNVSPCTSWWWETSI